jgi:hypothetical protein
MSSRGFLLVTAVVAFCAARPAYAAGGSAAEKEACITAYEKAQVLRKNGKLVEAKEKLLVCAQATCPSIARQDCATWLAEVSSSIPTIVVEAADTSGRPTQSVRVRIDGEVLAEKLDGTSLAVNPGAHQFRFELVDERGATKTREESVLVLQGDRNRKISVTFAPPQTERAGEAPPPPPAQGEREREREESAHPDEKPAPKKSAPIAGYILAGTAVVGAAGFTIFGLTGVAKENNLRNTCAPACAHSEVDGVLNRYRIADVSLIVGLVSGIAATWLLWPRSDAPSTTSAQARTPRVTPSVGPTGGGVSVEIPFL